MDDAGLMDDRERRGDLFSDPETLFVAERLDVLLDDLVEGLALEELHRDVRALLALDLGRVEVEHHGDVRVDELPARAGLALEALGGLRVDGDVRLEDLEGDRAIELHVSGAVDLARLA